MTIDNFVGQSIHIKLDHPAHIPPTLFALQERVRVGADMYATFAHGPMPSIIRGRSQKVGVSKFTEIRRPDGGLTWYHPHTYCFMKVSVVDESHRFAHRTLLNKWADLLIDCLVKYESKDSSDYVFDKENDNDIYVMRGDVRQQIVGLSAYTGKVNGSCVRIERAAWYEEDPMPAIRSLLYADGIDSSLFAQHFCLAKPGFIDYVRARFLIDREATSGLYIHTQDNRFIRKGNELQICDVGDGVSGCCVLDSVVCAVPNTQ